MGAPCRPLLCPLMTHVTWPMSLPVEFCSIGFNLNPFGISAPTGPSRPFGPMGALASPLAPAGSLQAPWGALCGPSLWGPPPRRCSIGFNLNPFGPSAPTGPFGALRAPWGSLRDSLQGPLMDDVTWPMSLPVEFCSIGFNLEPFGAFGIDGPLRALRAPWGLPKGTSSGPSDDDATWPMSLPVEFCSNLDSI